ncbi:hypothetical protein SAMN02745127_01815 [Oceanospirillum multiglobuliferum]|uniref:Uncharacterized protein n=1 Tax=Oceanospirillum multiglobuliferum TaxID=64969 RepID=A0A1T4QAP2_9GAMM|nr:hypothetical protein [Oceanospirillum multiglobuliferum]OPX56544.1 hypothetical protein BTE48_03735 [Oceanospirillum multiglobuliferum]SKA00850.1 hypothetical protein SAMN02745127_01815 [Oceanospirillum multiglobuliferum]
MESCNCGDKAEIGATVDFQCKICENTIERFSIKKPLKAASLAAILAYGGSQFIDYAITDNRYPLAVESAVLEACHSAYQEPLSYQGFESKKKICLCALEETMNEISYIRYKVDEKGFLRAFENNAKACK